MGKGIKNQQKGKEIKPKDDKTAQQEQCSVAAIYYFMTYSAAQMKQGKQAELLEKFKFIYPDIEKKENIAWKATFIEQAKTLRESGYIKKSGSYMYGWWDAPPKAMNSTKLSKVIGSGNTTSAMTVIWDKLFDKKTKELFGNPPKKDTWNTADMYMVQKGWVPIILRHALKIKKSFVDECCADRGTFVGTLNTYLTQLIKLKVLIPISLKKKTASVNLSVKPTNMHEWSESGGLDVVSGKFVKSPRGPGAYPWAFFNLVRDGSELTFGNPTGGRGGNSFQYFAQFKIGTYETEYLVEQRLTSGGSTKAEVKEIVLTNKGTKTRSAAQSGSVPMPAFRELIREYTDEDYDLNVPSLNSPITEVDYWRDYLRDRVKDNSIKFDLQGFNVLGTDYPIIGQAGTTWMDKIIEIDTAYLTDPRSAASIYDCQNPGKNFHAEVRLKLMQLRFLKALQSSGKELPTLITHVFYLAAKQNINEADIHGPFYKIS